MLVALGLVLLFAAIRVADTSLERIIAVLLAGYVFYAAVRRVRALPRKSDEDREGAG